MIRAAFESRDIKYLASQEFISIATVMTLRTISSVEAFLCLHGSMPIATLALWIVFTASSCWLFHQVATFSSCFSIMFLVCEEGVSSLSAISCTASRSARKVDSPQTRG